MPFVTERQPQSLVRMVVTREATVGQVTEPRVAAAAVVEAAVAVEAAAVVEAAAAAEIAAVAVVAIDGKGMQLSSGICVHGD